MRKVQWWMGWVLGGSGEKPSATQGTASGDLVSRCFKISMRSFCFFHGEFLNCMERQGTGLGSVWYVHAFSNLEEKF